MSNYSRQERLDIARAYKLAKYHVSTTYAIGAKEQFICHALRGLRDRGLILWTTYDRAKRIIMERLDGRGNCVESFLEEMGIDWRKYPRDEVQKYRHRWLDALIVEFSK